MKTRIILITMALCLAFTASARAQDASKKAKADKKAKATSGKPKKVVVSYDFYGLKRSKNVDGKSQSVALGADHIYGPAGSFGAPGKTTLSGNFDAAENYLILVQEHRAVNNVKFVPKGGKLIEFKEFEMSVRMTIKRPLKELDIGLRFGQANRTLNNMSQSDVSKFIQKLSLKGPVAKGKERKFVAKMLRLAILKDLEKTLVDCKALTRREALSREMGPLTTDSEIAKLSKIVRSRVLAEIWYSCEIKYLFFFGALGSGPADGPGAAFVPGFLGSGVGRITVLTDVAKGAERVYWYRLPGYSVSEHSLDGVKCPPGWMVRIFGPGPRSRGALLFVKIPSKAAGRFEFSWRKNDASGQTVVVQRPKPRSFPY
ncbi:MAG: hypothetical protein P1V97_02330 [Planctomycetota bacterium]|nr:hypothetical protein [Planctomycetota bacterium]